MINVLNHSYNNWKDEIKNYETLKKNIQWTQSEKPHKITHEQIKKAETSYNPILQKYNNETTEKIIKTKEKSYLIDNLAKNMDRTLRVEQVYNVINLQNKLVGFDTHRDFPRAKSEFRRKRNEETRQNHNIISNISLEQHHYLPPHQRTISTQVDKVFLCCLIFF